MTEAISRLMEANLLGVFNEREAGRRAAVINTIYSPDVRWTDDEGSTVGREALDAKATALQSQMQGLVFTKAGPVYQTRGLGYMAFELGPPGGEPVACGFDVAVVRNELISELYTVITGPRGDGPSQLLQAFIGYLRARPTAVDSASAAFVDGSSELEGVSRRSTELGGVPAVALQPQVGSPERTVLYFHGGGYVTGSPPERYLPFAAAVALAANARVFVVDYRLAPQTPFPGAFDDCLRAYQWLVTHSDSNPQMLAVLGDSAGGNLAVAVTAAARDQRLALPERIALLSPLADLTLGGASSSNVNTWTRWLPVRCSNPASSTTLPGRIRATPVALRSSPTCRVSPRCSSRSVRTRSSTTMPPVSEMPPPRLVSTCPSSLGDMEFTFGRCSSRPGYPSPLRPSNAWPPFSRLSLVIGQWVGGLPWSRD
jgi:acetyl esterase/lipase